MAHCTWSMLKNCALGLVFLVLFHELHCGLILCDAKVCLQPFFIPTCDVL